MERALPRGSDQRTGVNVPAFEVAALVVRGDEVILLLPRWGELFVEVRVATAAMI
jgi:hypothetical protein